MVQGYLRARRVSPIDEDLPYRDKPCEPDFAIECSRELR
jgi:hypothetical protein